MRARRAAGLLMIGLTIPTFAQAQSLAELQNLSIEQLANIQVISVSRRPEPLSKTPASVYVITADDIRRSGYARLADVLRLAPNLQVAQGSGQSYAVTARGMNSLTDANKMLVMIDGRSIYSSIHSETLWDQLQVPLDDIERIEVISGPGGTQWGPNAVNGVINIITKSSQATQGGFADLKIGPIDQNGLLQYGGKFGSQGTYRVYAQTEGVGSTVNAAGSSAHDGWHGAATGFRTDWASQDQADAVMTEGDFYRNNDAMMNGRQNGGEITTRWTHTLSADASFQIQSSYDQEDRYIIGGTEKESRYSLQGQENLVIGRNNIVWGANLSFSASDVRLLGGSAFVPAHVSNSSESMFVQDTVSITHNLQVTLGTKIQYSGYNSGAFFLPSIRLGWSIDDKNYVWAAVSRAVRTPSRIDHDFEVPGILALSPDFESEKLIAYEAGYRAQPASNLSLSVSLYYNTYSDLRTLDMIVPTVQRQALYVIGNSEAGDTYGLEAWSDWRVLENWGILKSWKLSAGVNLMHKNLHITKLGSIDEASGDDPSYQFSFRSSMNFSHNVFFDFGISAVSNLDNPFVKSYTQADARIAWDITPKLELSLTGNGLFAAHHAEIAQYVPPGPALLPFEAQRSIYLGLRVKF